jgi:protein-disulfide isomerase
MFDSKVRIMMIKSVLTIGLFSLTLVAPSFAASGDGSSQVTATMIEIDGTKLSFADIEKQKPGVFFHALNTLYQGEQTALKDFVDDFILDEQAKKEGLTVDQLLEKHVNSTIEKDPPEEALKVFYEGVDTSQPYSAVRDQIVQSIRARRTAKAKAAYMDSLRKDAKVSIRLAPPRAQVNLKDTPVRGPETAKVVLVEYADFECPYCQQVQPTLSKLEKAYEGKLAFAYKDVPLPMHSHAEKAAEASHCAAAQGKYWEYHDQLYSSRQLDVSALKEQARTLKLDGDAFDKCLDSGETAAGVKASLAEGQRLGIEGTPSFFMNGRFFSGGLTFEQLSAMIDEELKTAEGQTKTVASNE